jgi:hypothetical protein
MRVTPEHILTSVLGLVVVLFRSAAIIGWVG